MAINIAVIGTDGSGKTTLCKRLADSDNLEIGYEYLGFRHHSLSFVERYFKRYGDKTLLYRHFFFPVDLIFRRLRWSKAPLVIIDRLPGWPILSRNLLIKTLYRYLLPKIDAVVLIEADAWVLLERKKENSLKGYKKDMAKWRSVYNKLVCMSKKTFRYDSVYRRCVAKRINRFFIFCGFKCTKEKMNGVSNINLPLCRLFNALNCNNILYLVLRNFDEILAINYWGDIDVFIADKSMSRFKDILSELGWWKRKEPAEHFEASWYYYFDTKAKQLSCLNVYTELRFYDTQSMCIAPHNLDVFMKKIFYQDQFYIPSTSVFEMLYYAHIATSKKSIETKREKLCYQIDKQFILGKTEYGQALIKIVHHQTDQFDLIYHRQSDWEIMPEKRRKHRQKKRIVIVLIGTNCTGKTTLAKRLVNQLPMKTMYQNFGMKQYYFKIVSWAHRNLGEESLWYRYIFFPMDVLAKRFRLPKRINIINLFPAWPILYHRVLRLLYRLVLPKTDMLILLEYDVKKNQNDRLKWKIAYQHISAKEKAIVNIDISDEDETFRELIQVIFSNPYMQSLLFIK